MEEENKETPKIHSEEPKPSEEKKEIKFESNVHEVKPDKPFGEPTINTHDKPKKSSKNKDMIIIALAILLGVSLLANILITSGIGKSMDASMEEAEEASKPAQIELTIIQDSSCTDCVDITQLVETLQNVDITDQAEIEFDSDKGKELIRKHNIEKIPTIIVTGETEKAGLLQFQKSEDALVFTDLPPPYVDTTTGDVVGLVSVTKIISKDCEKCTDLDTIIDQLELLGITFGEETELEYTSSEAQTLLSKYELDIVPSLILSKDAEEYEVISQLWLQLGTVEDDGSYVVRNINPPAINITTGETTGLVDVTYLTDVSCETCYNVSEHRLVLANPRGLALELNNEITVDISDKEGKELVEKYEITKVPTIILSKQISDYSAAATLVNFFSIDDDGSHIFTSTQVMGTYKDLEKDEVVEPQPLDPQTGEPIDTSNIN
tara:strand:- start:389 stop:1696 length:1308 start_codon:yes stop_codon:yes gene_type:complete